MVLLVIYSICCLVLARHDARAIARDKTIRHNSNGVFHGVCWAVGWIYCIAVKEYFIIPCFPPAGRLFFDCALNLLRFGWQGAGYVSPDARQKHYTKGASKIDWYEYAVFRSGIAPKIIYALILIILIFIRYG